MKGRILTGHRPTGRRHLGHLAGTLQSWVKLQDEYECFFILADWHVLTTDYSNSGRIGQNIIDTLIDWLAAGIDPARSTIFLQSGVPEHAELTLLFSMLVTVSRLERNPTYKEQKQELDLGERASLGLLTYPVLQAADILIYRANVVPVGEDQLPHLELSREIARRFNNIYGELFPEPQSLLSATPRLLGIDGRMMHTSYGNTIPLSAPPEEVREKVMSMTTDPERIHKSDPGHPGVCNVFSYYQAFQKDIEEQVRDECEKAKIGCVECKRRLAEFLVEKLQPFREKRAELIDQPDRVIQILAEGTPKARKVARETIEMVRERMKLDYTAQWNVLPPAKNLSMYF